MIEIRGEERQEVWPNIETTAKNDQRHNLTNYLGDALLTIGEGNF